MSEMRAKLGIDNTQYNKGLEDSGKKTKQFSNTVGKMGKKTKVNATPALTDLSRTIQDMPYGIQGVANNIQQLTAQFGYLSNQTNSATGKALGFKGAVGAMAGAIVGPAGILFAVSALTSLWVAYEKEIYAAIGTTDLMGDAIKDASEGIGEQINKLTSLTEAYADSNTGPEDKKNILKELAKDYPKYFSDINTEKDGLMNVKKAYDLQKEAIMGMGLIKALEAKKAPIYAKQAEMMLKTEIGWWDQLKIAIGTTARASTGALGLLGAVGSGDGMTDLNNQLAEIDKLAESVKKKYGLTDTDILGDIGGKKKGDKEKRERASAITGIPTANEILKLGDEGKRAWAQVAKEYQLDEFIGINPFTADEVATAEANLKQQEQMREHYKTLEAQAEAFNQNMESIVGANLANTFGQIGEVIGEALVNGGDVLGAIGGVLIQGLANFLSDMGGMLIEYGSLAIAKGILDKAIVAGGPAAIIAGAAAIGVGIALKAAGSAINARAGQGLSSGGSQSSPSGSGNGGFSRGSSQTSSFSNGGGGGTVVFKIAGTDLVGVLNRNLDRNKALGGTLSLG